MYIKTTELVGKGNFSEVYQATSPDGNSAFAWKQLKYNLDASDKERFQREAEILSILDHECVIEIVYADLLAPQPYFVMPRARHNLEFAIKYDINRQLNIQRIFKKVCGGVIYAHQNNVLHRDLKPQNILLFNDGSVKISDFGLACFLHSHKSRLTLINETGGTHQYVAPEQFDISLRDVDARADVFSLGKILYYLYTKSDPYVIDGSHSHLPKSIYAVIKKATDLDIGMRFANVEVLLEEFLKAVSEKQPLPPLNPTPHLKKYVAVQLEAQNIAMACKAKGFLSKKEIEKAATDLQQLIWFNRKVLWGSAAPGNPLELLNAPQALDLLGLRLIRSSTLGTFFENGEQYEVAGQINQMTREVSISMQFDRQVTRFTEAHELGHALLHKLDILHRDRPINGSLSVKKFAQRNIRLINLLLIFSCQKSR